MTGEYRVLKVEKYGLSLNNCGLQSADPAHSCGPIVRDEQILQYVIAGRGKLIVHGNVYPVKAGDMFLLEAGAVLSYHADPDDPYVYYWVGFSGDGAGALMSAAGFAPTRPVRTLNDPEAERCMREIYECADFVDDAHVLCVLSDFYKLLAILAPSSPGRPNPANSIVNRAIALMQERYREEVHIGELCREIGVERTYFSVLFRRATGTSPGEYLIRYRLNRACALMSSDLSITEIAMTCGFPDAANFSVRFRKFTGVSPRDYRRSLASTD